MNAISSSCTKCDEMLAHGVTDYSMSECLASNQMGCMNMIVIGVIAATIFQRRAAMTHDLETLRMMEKITGTERRDCGGEDDPMKWGIPEGRTMC